MVKKVLFVLVALSLLVMPVLAAENAKPYPLDTCIVSGEKLDKSAVSITHEGQEIKFCCKDCIKKFNADPKKYLAAMEEKAKAKAKPDPAKKG